MSIEEILQYCQQKKGSRMDFPFGYIPVCFKVCDRLFAEIYPKEGDQKLTLRCDPFLAEVYRQQHPGTVVPGYHCPVRQRPYKNTVYLNNGLPDELLQSMIDHSYDEAVKRLKKADRDELEMEFV